MQDGLLVLKAINEFYSRSQIKAINAPNRQMHGIVIKSTLYY